MTLHLIHLDFMFSPLEYGDIVLVRLELGTVAQHGTARQGKP